MEFLSGVDKGPCDRRSHNGSDVLYLFYDKPRCTSKWTKTMRAAEKAARSGAPSGRAPRSIAPPGKRGKAKYRRGDVPHVVVGLAVTQDGFSARHWVFPGNTVGVTIAEGRVYASPGHSAEGEADLPPPLIRVHSRRLRPGDAHMAIRYRNHWF